MRSAAILAGGRARRLGGHDKSALVVDGVRFLDRQIAALRPLVADILLVGYPGNIPEACTAVEDRVPGAGPLGAIISALVATRADRLLVLAADLPFVTTPFLDSLFGVDERALAVVPVTGDRWQPLCAVYDRRALRVLSDAFESGERSVQRAVAALEPSLVRATAIAPDDTEGRLLANVNTPADLARWKVTCGPNRTAGTKASQTITR